MTDQSSYYERYKLIKLGQLPKEAVKKEKKPLNKKSEKKKAEEAEERKRRGDDDTDLQKFFKSAMKRMVGVCSECGLKTETHIYTYAINSICHILAKRKKVCPSVAHDPNNWIELCEHHHGLLDKSNWEEIERWGCWPEIVERLILVYPNIDPAERRHFPESVLKIMQKHSNS